MKKLFAIWLILMALIVVGEIKCFIKMVSCNWEPIGKAEIIYTASFFTGVGAVTGWITIEDK